MVTVDPDQIREELYALIEAELATARTVEEALREEHQALTGNDAPGLEQAVKTKTERLGELAGLAERRTALLEASGYSGDPQGLDACIRHNDAKRKLATLWQEFSHVLEQCKRQNQINAGIVELSQQHIEQALNLLRGQGRDPELYDPNGRTVSGGRSRPLARA